MSSKKEPKIIERSGAIKFGDASLNILEEGLGKCKTYEDREAWERLFKKQVFKRIIQAMNRLEYECIVPQDKIDDYWSCCKW